MMDSLYFFVLFVIFVCFCDIRRDGPRSVSTAINVQKDKCPKENVQKKLNVAVKNKIIFIVNNSIFYYFCADVKT